MVHSHMGISCPFKLFTSSVQKQSIYALLWCKYYLSKAQNLFEIFGGLVVTVIKHEDSSSNPGDASQCDQIGLFLKGFGDKFFYKSSPNIVVFLGNLKSNINAVATVWATFEKNEMFVLSSGHIDASRNRGWPY